MEQSSGQRQHGPAAFIKHRPILVIAIAVIIIGAIIAYNVIGNRPPENISVNGIIEATEVIISSKITARITNVNYDEGSKVAQGAVLVRLRPDEFQDQVKQAQAQVEAAQAALNEAIIGTRPELIDQDRAQVAQAESAVTGARRDLNLAEQSYADRTELHAKLEQAQTNYNSAVQAYNQAKENLQLVRSGARSEQIAQAQAALNQAIAQSNRAQEDFRRAETLYKKGAIPASQLDAARSSAETAQAQVDQARAGLQELQTGARPEEIRRSEAALKQAQDVMNGLQKSLSIARQQYQSALQERQQLTDAQTRYQTTQAQLEAARAKLQELVTGPTKQQIDQLRANVNQAQAALSQALTQLGYTIVKSPIDGTVITRAVEPGELASAGSTLMVLADLHNVWLRVYIEETVYGRIRLGQTAYVTVDSYPGTTFRGKVTEIASQAEFTPREIQTKDQRAKLVYGVKVTIPNTDGRLKPGMPADAVLKLYPVTSTSAE